MHDALIAMPFGLAIGVLLGLVGAGGSILAVPVLVYVLGEPVKQATTESLLIVGLTALAGALAAAREHRVRWRVGLAFAAAGRGRGARGHGAEPAGRPDRDPRSASACCCSRPPYGMTRAPRRLRASPPHLHVRPRVGAAGAATGLLTGFFGVGGGFLIVPALTLGLAFPMALAVGTSLLVIALTSGAALARTSRAAASTSVLASGFAARGDRRRRAGRLHGRVPELVLRRLFAALLLAVGLAVVAWNVAVLV